jgi:ABC-type multidrug transport system ATPase subunit
MVSHENFSDCSLRAAEGVRDKIVLDGIDLDVPAGTVFSLLGPNGRARRRR